MVILTFTAVLKIVFTLDTRKENINLTLLWLYPFLLITAESNNTVPLLTIYLFNKKIYGKELNTRKTGTKNNELVKAVSPTDMHFNVSYGFRDPFVTGVTCGAIYAASEYIRFASIEQSPDFIADSDYIYMNATAKVNIGNTLIHYIKSKTKLK
jgi:hypothetical protein